MRKIYKTVSNQKPKTTVNKLSKLECAYLAGMIDADGSICKCKNRDSFVCKVRVHNSSEKLMIWLKKKIGAGNINHLPPAVDKQGFKHTKDRWDFDLSAKVDVIEILKQINPYLIIKKEKSKMILNLIPTMKRPNKYKKRSN